MPDTAGFCHLDVSYVNGEKTQVTPFLNNL
jgi:hypothetical protein